ncbi:Amino-acid acetyltransferase, mitochondrial [Irineochytrium annulatum]|nr:Amino-acid acetyltransferase, mitochondrial [Irineochytrium annulatum]
MPTAREAKQYLDKFWRSGDNNKKMPTASLEATDALSLQAEKSLAKAPDTRPHAFHLGLFNLDSHLQAHDLSSLSSTLHHLQMLGLSPVLLINFDHYNRGRAVHPPYSHPSHRRRRQAALLRPESDRSQYQLRALMRTEALRVVEVIEGLQAGVVGKTQSSLERKGGGVNGVGAAASDGARGRCLLLESADVFEVVEPAAGVVGAGSVRCLPGGVDAIRRAFQAGRYPVLTPLATTAGSKQVLVNPRDCLQALAHALGGTAERGDAAAQSSVTLSSKVVFVNGRGGISVDGHVVRFLNLADEYELIRGHIGSPILNPAGLLGSDAERDLHDLESARAVLARLPPESSAVVTSAAEAGALIGNLITNKPIAATTLAMRRDKSSAPATVIRRGVKVRCLTSLDDPEVDLSRLEALMDASFGKKLQAKAYWDRIRDRVGEIIIAGDYDGAAIVTREPLQTDAAGEAETASYLDKFAVAPSSQGIGVADILWKRLRCEFPDLVWRSRVDNPVNRWYFDRSVGNCRVAGEGGFGWMVFWYGTKGISRLNAYCAMAAGIPASFAAARRK